MPHQQRIVLGWLLLLICMILHFDYHVSEIFYGIDVKRPDATGVVPNSILIIRSMFHFFPVLIILVVSSLAAKGIRLTNFVLAVLYMLSHAMHLVGELRAPHFNPSQVMLLALVLVVSGWLSFISWQWFKGFSE